MKIMLTAACAAVLASSAGATLITRTYEIEAGSTGSGPLGEMGPPVVSASVAFTVTFDTEVAVANRTAGAAIRSASFSLQGPAAFDYMPGNDTLTVGMGFSGSLMSGTDDFIVTIFNASKPSADARFMVYTQSIAPGLFFAPTILKFSAKDDSAPLSAAPEPSSWAMMLLGFGGLGYALRRRSLRYSVECV